MVYVSVVAGVGDCEVELKETILGTVVSSVIEVVAVAAEVGPVLAEASLAPLATKRGMMVPSLQLVIATVRVVPDVSVPGLKEHPVAVPVLVKSAEATPVTASEKVMV
jgi:hypothetical protein